MRALHTAGDAVLAGLCSAVYERDRTAREAAIRALGCETRDWFEWAGSEAVMVTDWDRGRLACVLRGTEVTRFQWRDVMANLGIPSPWAGPGMAHTGYLRQLDRVLDEVARAILTCGAPVVLSGHSMGGALATLLAVRLVWRRDAGLGVYPISEVVTFGAPKSVSSVAAGHITCPARRYAVDGDPAPLWPPIPGLAHPAPAIRLPAPCMDPARGLHGLWPLRHHDVDIYAGALAVPHG